MSNLYHNVIIMSYYVVLLVTFSCENCRLVELKDITLLLILLSIPHFAYLQKPNDDH